MLQGNLALLKAFIVVDAIAEGHRHLKGICEHVDLPKSTVHRIVQGLIHARYVREVHGIGLVLGTKMIQLGNKAQEDMPLKEIAQPYLRELSMQTKETVHLGIKDEDEVFYLDKVIGARQIQMRSRIGDRLPMATTGVGKALMLDMPKTEWQRLITKADQTKQEVLMERMKRYAKKGHSFDLEDNDDFVRCVAVPIRNRYGNIIAAISVTSIEQYMPDSRMKELVVTISETCEQISQEICKKLS